MPASSRRATDNGVEGVEYGDAAVAEADVIFDEKDEDDEDEQVAVEQVRALHPAWPCKLHQLLRSLCVATSFVATSTSTPLSLTSKLKALKFGCLVLMLILVDGRDGAKTRSP